VSVRVSLEEKEQDCPLALALSDIVPSLRMQGHEGTFSFSQSQVLFLKSLNQSEQHPGYLYELICIQLIKLLVNFIDTQKIV
jgi:hypothetical protein